MTQHVNLPIHRECDRAPVALAAVSAALHRAGYSDPGSVAQFVDQLAAERDAALAQLAAQRADAQELLAQLDDAVEQIDRARARYATRPGSQPGSAHDVGTLIRHCVYPGCPRTYRADVGPQDRGWMRLRGLAVLCPDHSTAAGSTQDTAPPAESHTRSPGDPGAGVGVGGALPTAHSGSQPAARWRNDQ
ncbi:hypothetical protein [Salinispora arenicola]|uniref:hypothetical protein n=1 Tax=Salinispora arenicola TaxID=168697 RepID=UPI0003805B69|nr:hypothetical protein [Salinispora arenicola]